MTKNKRRSDGELILFCGLPGTLKTYLSVRLSGRLGYGYLPTRSVGEITHIHSADELSEARQERYEKLAKAALSALELGANVIVDGGFMTQKSRSLILNHRTPHNTIIVNCLCQNDTIRKRRLAIRALDVIDYENKSAKEILKANEKASRVSAEDLPETELRQGRVRAILNVDTVEMNSTWTGDPPKELLTTLPIVLKELMDQYSKSAKSHGFELAVRAHFDELAADYESTTEWRRDESLLKSLRRTLPEKAARVVDIGAGTGLASEWYAQQGHIVTGIDLSPKMLRRAAERLTITVLGDATRLPFFDDYFDLVIIRQCLHYVDPKHLLEGVNRTLRPGGLLVVSASVSPDNGRAFWQEFKAVTQPLRLRVFTAREVLDLLHEFNFLPEEPIISTITRSESLSSFEKRVAAPHGGWKNFFENMAKIANSIVPEIKFSFDNGVVEYQQHWITVWATLKE